MHTPLVNKQVTYQNVGISAQHLPDGSVHLVVNAGHEVLVFPMAEEVAQQLSTMLRTSKLQVVSQMPTNNNVP